MKLDNKTLFATIEQELLLKASLMDGEDAIHAWQEWESMVDLEGHPDNGSYRLFPLLYTNLKRHGIEHPFMIRLRGIYRQAWYKNQRLFYDMSKVLRYFSDAGVRTIVLKGAALTILHYKNYGVRPMADVDVLVHPHQVMLTVDLLRRAGWKPLSEITDDDLYYNHATHFYDSTGREFDLHWHPFWDACRKNNDSEFWSGAIPVSFTGVPTLAPNSTDNLLHTIVHGIKYNPEPPIRWIADAFVLIHSSNEGIDWTRLVNQAKYNLLVPRLREALYYLLTTFKVPVPQSVMDQLNEIPVTRAELIEYQERTANPENRKNSLLSTLAQYLTEYRRITGNFQITATILGFPPYLRWRLNKKSYYHLSSFIITKSIDRVRTRLYTRMRPNGAGESS